ncbi:MAG: hypothetical protein ACYTAF_12900, partial [Planctomycetota bacterium]
MRGVVTKRRGAALIVVLGVLVVLALLATTFATLSGVERHISKNYLDDVRAKLVAMAGVEDCLQRLLPLVEDDMSQSQYAHDPKMYFGTDDDESGDNPIEFNQPLEDAKSPSFAVEVDGDPTNSGPGAHQSRLLTLLDRGVTKEIGVTGIHLSGTYAQNGDFYSVRIQDLQGLIYVNDGEKLFGGNDSSVSQNLKRILNALGDIETINIPNLGDTIVNNRPAGGYQAVQQLETTLGSANFDKVKNFLTVRAWVDKDVCNPVPLSPHMLTYYPVDYYRGTGVYRYGHNVNMRGKTFDVDEDVTRLSDLADYLELDAPAHDSGATYSYKYNQVWGFDELNPQWIEMVERAPININSAPKEVLIALLHGLQGIFLIERPRDAAPADQAVYQWIKKYMRYDPYWESGYTFRGEVGNLCMTLPFEYVGSGSTPGDVIPADTIAEHIIRCRMKETCDMGVVSGGPIDYGTQWFGGTFRTWKQFNAFVDHLVEREVIKETRTDDSWGEVIEGLSQVGTPSLMQESYASQAIADVLKANFNPNMHLNEINPDRNLWQWVDKTDLMVNSTEFCFTPMGYFLIESLGRVVKPSGGYDVFAATSNELIAEKKVTAVVKLFDVYRETSQKQFYEGDLGAQATDDTNNNLALELGPEPDQGVVPSQNEWDGYVQLSTIGGYGVNKTKSSLDTTPAAGSTYGEIMRGHWAWDMKLSYHVNAGANDGVRNNLASNNMDFTFQGTTESVFNHPDRTETIQGPYVPTMDSTGRYRLAKSFRIDDQGYPELEGNTVTLEYYAPLDLRMDGVYSERNSGWAYWLSDDCFIPSIQDNEGVFAVWLKPSFFPELAGKPRILMTADRFHGGSTTYIQPSPFFLVFSASNDKLMHGPSAVDSDTEFETPTYQIL